MARKDFDTTEYHGGRVTPDAPKPRLRYPCFASECPMPGTLFTNGTDKPGVCAWHYGVQGVDVPRVTQVLKDWGCVSYEVNAARRALTDLDIAASPKHLAERFDTAWERLKPLVPGWEAQLAPNGTSYGDWAKHLEAFIGARVVEALGVRRTRPAHTTRAHAFAPLPTPAPQVGEIAAEVLG